jgi:hypothetical protein
MEKFPANSSSMGHGPYDPESRQTSLGLFTWPGDVGFPKKHLVPRATVVDKLTKAGYKLLREHTFFPVQYFLECSPAP